MTAPKDRERAEIYLRLYGDPDPARYLVNPEDRLEQLFAQVRAEERAAIVEEHYSEGYADGERRERARWLAVLPKCDECQEIATYWALNHAWWYCDKHRETSAVRVEALVEIPWAELVKGDR